MVCEADRRDRDAGNVIQKGMTGIEPVYTRGATFVKKGVALFISSLFPPNVMHA